VPLTLLHLQPTVISSRTTSFFPTATGFPRGGLLCSSMLHGLLLAALISRPSVQVIVVTEAEVLHRAVPLTSTSQPLVAPRVVFEDEGQAGETPRAQAMKRPAPVSSSAVVTQLQPVASPPIIAPALPTMAEALKKVPLAPTYKGPVTIVSKPEIFEQGLQTVHRPEALRQQRALLPAVLPVNVLVARSAVRSVLPVGAPPP